MKILLCNIHIIKSEVCFNYLNNKECLLFKIQLRLQVTNGDWVETVLVQISKYYTKDKETMIEKMLQYFMHALQLCIESHIF